MPQNDFDIDKFKSIISDVESGGQYDILNKTGSSATGKYQFIWSIWADKIKAQTGVESQDEFLNTPEAQEEFMDYVINTDYLPAIDKLKSNNPEATANYNDEQLLALVHFQGAGGADNYLKTGKMINEKNNISVSNYLSHFGEVNTDSNNQQQQDTTKSTYQPLQDIKVGNVEKGPLGIDFSVSGENMKTENKVNYKPMSVPGVNTSFTGQQSLFKLGGNMYRKFDLGGPMQGMPSEGQVGQLTSFDTGGSHEENVLGGIPQGMNPNGQQNLVEEGETKLNSKSYIFSDTLKLDKDTAKEFYFPNKYVGKTFAEISKLMDNSKSRRVNDSIEENAKRKDLDSLMYAQEEFKQKDLEKDLGNMMAKHPEFMQSMMAPQMPQEQLMDPSMMQGGEQPMGLPMESPMAKFGGYQNKMDFGGFMKQVGQVGKNYGLALADNALGMVGADNVIKDSDYAGAGANFARNAQKVTGAITKVGAGIAANALLPGVGGQVLGGVQGAMSGAGGENTVIQNGQVVPVNQMDNGGPLSFSLPTDLSFDDGFAAPVDDPRLSFQLGALQFDDGFDTPTEKGVTPSTKNKRSGLVDVAIPGTSNNDLIGNDTAKEVLSQGPQKQEYNQSLLNAAGTYTPALYNIGMGLFGKTEKIDPDDIIKSSAKLKNYRENINPQLRASNEAFAGAKKGLRNSGAGSGAYLANLQALHSQDQAQKAGIYANAENQYLARQLQIDQANRGSQDNKNAMRLQIADYNARADAAKQKMLQEGLKQVGDISKAKTSNELATMFNNLYAPDFKDYASYKSYMDNLKKLAQQYKSNKKKD